MDRIIIWIILKLILKRHVRERTGFIWLAVGFYGVLDATFNLGSSLVGLTAVSIRLRLSRVWLRVVWLLDTVLPTARHPRRS